MKFEVIFSLTAIETFDSIRDQIDNRWGGSSVENFELRVLNVLDIIANSPFVFKGVPVNPNIRKGFIHHNCSMFYEIKEQTIEILFFWDNRQDPVFL